jgi:4'-phosphopantetheinyl transferase EntD
LAVAVVSSRVTLRAIGIDVEPAVQLEAQLAAMFGAPGEPPLPANAELADSLRFSCKEAAFKCWFVAGGGRILEFQDVRLEASENAFIALAPEPGPQRIQGRWAHSRGHWWSAAWEI